MLLSLIIASLAMTLLLLLLLSPLLLLPLLVLGLAVLLLQLLMHLPRLLSLRLRLQNLLPLLPGQWRKPPRCSTSGVRTYKAP